MLRLAIGLTWTTILMLLIACDSGSNPNTDLDQTMEMWCDGKDDDSDGIIDEGRINRCGGCGEVPDSGCLNTSLLLSMEDGSDTSDLYAMQTQVFPNRTIELTASQCTLSRTVIPSNPLLEHEMILSHGSKTARWSSNGVRVDNHPAQPFNLTDEEPIYFDSGHRSPPWDGLLQLEIPSSLGDSAQSWSDACVEALKRGRPESFEPIPSQASYLYMGGSRHYETSGPELITAFFVIGGLLDDPNITPQTLDTKRINEPSNVRCALGHERIASKAVETDGFSVVVRRQYTSTATNRDLPSSGLDGDERYIEVLTSDAVRFRSQSKENWGPPHLVRVTRTGMIGDRQHSDEISCPIRATESALVVPFTTLFPAWIGRSAPRTIARVEWIFEDIPSERNPNLLRRELLTIQREL